MQLSVEDDLHQSIICRDIAKFQSNTACLNSKHGNKYLIVFIESLDPCVNIESHEYILSSILKLDTKFKKKYIVLLLKKIQNETLAKSSRWIDLLIRMIKRIDINDNTMLTVLKMYQKYSDIAKRYLIQELLTCVSYFSLYNFIKQSDLDTSWIGFLTRDCVHQEELEYYSSKLKDTQLLYKLKSMNVVFTSVTHIDSLITSSKLKTVAYLLESRSTDVQRVSQEAITELSAVLKGRKKQLARCVVNMLAVQLSELECVWFVNQVCSYEIPSWILPEYNIRKESVKTKVINMCVKYVHYDICKHVILECLC
jgi:hypothetical protein